MDVSSKRGMLKVLTHRFIDLAYLGEIFGCLSFACARGPSRCATHAKIEAARERHVAFIGKRRDDETHRVA